MPIDYGTIDLRTAYLDTITELDGFISVQSFDNLIICGDFNVDFSRASHHRLYIFSRLMTVMNDPETSHTAHLNVVIK